MKTGQKGVDLIKKWEGLRTKAYQDVKGVWTIGYGHTSAAGSPEVSSGLVISEKTAEDILRNDLFKFESEVNSLVKVPVSQNQFDALVSFHYNTGALGKSTLLKKLNSKNYDAVPSELMKWVNSGGKFIRGLENRRKEEVKLWNDGKAPEKPVEAKPHNQPQSGVETISEVPATSNQPWWLTLILSLLRAFTRGK